MFVKDITKQRFRSDLRTIRESPETVYTVRYLDMEEIDEGIPVPEVEPSVPGVIIVEIEDVDPDHGDTMVGDHVDDGEESDEVKDLRHLNERADRLSKELKQLNIDANQAKCSKIHKKVQKNFGGFLVQKVGIFTRKRPK